MSLRRILPVVALLMFGAGAVWWSHRDAVPPAQSASIPQPRPAPAESFASVSAEATAAAPALSARARALLAALQRLAADRDRRAREALLTFKDDAALQRFLARVGENGLTVIDRLDGLRTVRVRYDELGGLQRELLANADDFEDVSSNGLMQIPSAPRRESRAARDHVPFGNDTLAFLGANEDRSNWGRGVTIAIIDSGVAADPTFGDRLRRLDLGLGMSPGKGEADGHGTSVAALAAGMAPDAGGIASAANLLSIRVTDADGLSDVFTVARAIVAAVDSGAKVLNISLGGHSTNATLNAAIGYATQQGAVIVAAAGNDQAAQLAWPAADDRVVSVGAIDKAEQQVAFSNSGPQLKLTAPGYGVQTAWLEGQRAQVDGTSASAPLVAGAIAAVISQNPSLTPPQAVELLVQTASDAGAPGGDPAYGSGILNVGWALNRNSPSYADPAIATHHFDAEDNQMQFVVQNRSNHAVSGLQLDVAGNGHARRYSVPSLAAGESHVVSVPVDSRALKAGSSIRYSTTLSTPAGLVDRVPSNNQRASVLTAPTP